MKKWFNAQIVLFSLSFGLNISALAQDRNEVLKLRKELISKQKSLFSQASTKVLIEKVLKPISIGKNPQSVSGTLKNWYQKQKNYQDLLDRYILFKQSHFINKTRGELKRLVCQLPQKTQKKRLKKKAML